MKSFLTKKAAAPELLPKPATLREQARL